jgi:putative porin
MTPALISLPILIRVPYSVRRFVCGAGILALLWAVPASYAATATPAPVEPASALTFSGDLRLRYEWDWDSHNGSGVARTDRDRARVRARLNAGYKFSSEWSFGARLRTGNRFSQQSPHLTFSSNDHLNDDFEVQLDRYFVQYKTSGFTGWAGRNNSPFWQQNEFLWDDDVTPTGVAGTYETKIDEGSLAATVGAFYLPDGAVDLNGHMLGGQLKYSIAVKPSQFTVAAGLHFFDGKNGAKNLRNRNGARDYAIGVLSAQWSTPLASGIPLTLGADFFNNFEDYSAADAAPLSPTNADETTGYVLSVQIGQLKKAHDWTLGYYYAHMGTFAVNASYSQDDWQRFGSGSQTDGTDIKGHELRASYAISKSINVVARYFIVDAITSVQDGKRFRIDLNWKF